MLLIHVLIVATTLVSVLTCKFMWRDRSLFLWNYP